MGSVVCDLYCRVSTAGQASDGYSIGEQEERLKAYAKANGWIVNNVCVDGGYTGKNMNRPGLQCVIDDAKARRINRVVVYKMDRLSRSQKEMLYLIEDVFIANKVDFVSMTETLDTSTPIGMAMIGILSAFAQLEREQIKERMMLGRTARANEGLWRGGGKNPIGYAYDKASNALVVVPEEAQIVRKIFEMYDAGETATGISRYLNTTYTSGTRRWHVRVITRILRNSLYIGRYEWQGKQIEAQNHEAIISEDIFNRVQADLDRRCPPPTETKPQTGYKHKTLLGGMLWCKMCGSRYISYKDRSTTGPIWRYYCFARASKNNYMGLHKCKNRGWRCDQLNQYVVGEIRKLHSDRSLLADISAQMNRRETEIADLNARLESLNKRTLRLLELYEVGTIDANTIATRTDAISAEKAEIQKRIDKLKDQPTGLDPYTVNTMLDTFASIADNAGEDYMELYPIVHELIKSITLDGDTVEITWNFE